MYNTTTSTVKTYTIGRTINVTALTSDTMYRLFELLTGDRYTSPRATEEEATAIEMNAYVANMGAESKDSAWTRFCELCTNPTTAKGISDEVKSILDRYEVRTYDTDDDTIECGTTYATKEEAIEALTEAMSDSGTHHGMVYDNLAGIATYSTEKDYRYTVVREYREDRHFNTADEVANYIAETLCDSYEGEEAYDEMLDECNEEVNICGMTYSPSECLKRVDPIAYRCGLSDWADSERSDILYNIERMDEGDTESCIIADVTLEAVLTCYDITTHEEKILPLIA